MRLMTIGIFLITCLLLTPLNSFGGGIKWPTTVDDAVNMLYSQLTENEIEAIIYTPKSLLPKFHLSLGLNIRNNFGLREGNEELLESCGSKDMNPDDASGLIVERLWAYSRGRLPKDKLAKLKAVHSSMDNITIKPFDYHKLPLIDVVNKINSQILEQKYSFNDIEVSTLNDTCNSNLITFTMSDEASLSYTLNRLEFHSGMKISYSPPKILLCGK